MLFLFPFVARAWLGGAAPWAEALEPGQLCLMSCPDVRELLFTDPRIALRIAE